MATPKYQEQLIIASGVVGGFASMPAGVDNVVWRVESGTARWSEMNAPVATFPQGANTPNASAGIVVSAADGPIRSGNPSALRLYAASSPVVVQAQHYQGFFVL